MTSALTVTTHWEDRQDPAEQQQQPQQAQRFPTWGVRDKDELLDTTHEEDEDDDEDDDDEDDDEIGMEDGTSSMSSSPSIPDENINFDLVYALHTFAATVEGQASVVKGDALILMEDTNIYWWLVEVLKTREIGYIPAENIETPYERLARLNKHRNVEITSPSAPDFHPSSSSFSASSEGGALLNAKRVTIATGANLEMVTYFEVESDVEDENELDCYYIGEHELSNQHEHEEHEVQDAEEEEEDHQQAQSLHRSVTNESMVECTIRRDTSTTSLTSESSRSSIQELVNLRVFAGNIGQGPLFHSFAVTASTTADELTREAVSKFGTAEDTGRESTIEYYIAVQGTDGDDCVLGPQDKPLSIFRTLTAPLTTPMPSGSHRNFRKPQKEGEGGRRKRSSSFSNYEQTSYEEDSVIRFYLHRRIKRAHDNEELTYIKISLCPDTTDASYTGSTPKETTVTSPSFLSFKRSKKKKRKQAASAEIDRIDKILPVCPDLLVGAVVNLALEKFHVPDAEADGYISPENQHPSYNPLENAPAPKRVLSKYRMSMRANGTESELDPNMLMADVLQSHHEPVSTDLHFILRHVSSRTRTKPAPLINVGKAKDSRWLPQRASLSVSPRESRRPSILDILMDSPRLEDFRRPSFKSNGSLTSPLGERRPSQNSSLTIPHERSSSLINTSSGSPLPHLASGYSSITSASNLSVLTDRVQSESGIAEDDALSRSGSSSATGDTETSDVTGGKGRKKDGTLKQQLKRLVGWGNSGQRQSNGSPSATTPTTRNNSHGSIVSNLLSPTADGSYSSGSGHGVGQTPSDISFVSSSQALQSAASHYHDNSKIQIDEGSQKIEHNDPLPLPALGHLSSRSSVGSPMTSSHVAESSGLSSSITVSTDDSEGLRRETAAMSDMSSSSDTHSEDDDADASYETAEEEEQAPTQSTAAAPVSSVIMQEHEKPLVGPAETGRRGPSIDGFDTDLLLLVTQGVDYLKRRETSQWEEEEGGVYEYHPWNRSQSMLVTQPNTPIETPTQDKPADHDTQTIDSHESQPSNDSRPLSPTMATTPTSPRVSTIKPEISIASACQQEAQPQLALSPQQQKQQSMLPLPASIIPPPKESTDDEELKWMVASHIVF